MNYETVIVEFPDYYQEHLAPSMRTSHWEVRRNFGTTSHPNWQTVKYADTESEAKEWALSNPQMPVGYAEQQPSINLAGIHEHLQPAFAGIIY